MCGSGDWLLWFPGPKTPPNAMITELAGLPASPPGVPLWRSAEQVTLTSGSFVRLPSPLLSTVGLASFGSDVKYLHGPSALVCGLGALARSYTPMLTSVD